MNKPMRPRDPNQLAKLIVDMAIAGASMEPRSSEKIPDGKDPAAVSLGRRGGLKGGAARAKALTSKQRSVIAKNAAKARWKKAQKNGE